MKTPKRQKRKGVTIEEHEEHVISILASLLKNCEATQRQRILSKFTEADHEKVERLMELHFKYLDKVQDTEERWTFHFSKDAKETYFWVICRLRELVEQGEEDLDDDELYIRRLSGGLFTLQLVNAPNQWKKEFLTHLKVFSLSQVDYIVVDACASGASSIKQRVQQILNQRKASIKTIRNIVREYADNIGDTDDQSDDAERNREEERSRLLHLVDKF